jgi:ribonuclease VapC
VIIDSSALLAILRDESDADIFARAIAETSIRRLSAATLLETSIVIDGSRNPISSRRLDDLIASVEFIVEPVTAEHARIGRAAYRDFGRGSGHPARLNFGDCFAYALAKTSGEQLLFKGDDFGHTDLQPAV